MQKLTKHGFVNHKVLGEHLDDLVHLAKTVGRYVNSEKGTVERQTLWEQLNYEYEDFCEWRHEEPYRNISMSELIKQQKEELLDTLSHSPKKEREGIQVVDWEDILIFINHYKEKGGNSSQD